MKILQVITSLHMGGAETLVVNLIPRFRSLGHEVDVCVFNGAETPLTRRLRSENPGIHIYSLGSGYYNPLYILRLIPLMRRYDIVHTHNSSPQLFTAIASVFCCHAALCTTEHTTSNRKRKWKWYAPIESRMYSVYDHVICISRIAEDKLREYMGGQWLVPGSTLYSKISTVNNGVDTTAIGEAAPIEGMHPAGKFVAVMVARFGEAKDQDTLIRAAARLPEDFEVWLVGTGGGREETVKALVRDMGMENRVKFLGMRTDVPRILKSADAVVMSSHWEGLSLSNIEGMSADKPFIASDVNGLREVTAGYGLLFPDGDDRRLAEILLQLRDDPALYAATAEKCRRRALDFDISLTAKSYDAIYRSIMASRGKA